ncbi:hypothetical protein EII22_01690 [Coriobacteriales bacterium OH1046]|nr:hypothetical protein EII22_01690 [Coriobacteriales bacterium OH1046]
MIDESTWRAYVASYDIEVPEESVAREYEMVRADMKHRMMYAQMSGGETHVFPDQELAEMEDELREAAAFEAKEPLVLRDLTKKLDVTVAPEELLAEAEAMAKRQGTTVGEIKRFFGDDLAFLERDVRENKIREWACEQ